MKFKFCGDLDCPDWALAAISLLTKLTSIKMRQLVQEVTKCLIHGTQEFDIAQKICYESKLSSEDTKIVLAAVEFFVGSAARFSVNADTFCSELQQLGFPKEHATILSKVYQTATQLPQALQNSTFNVGKLINVKSRASATLQPDSEDTIKDQCLLVDFQVEKADAVTSYDMTITPQKLLLLKHEVAEILHIMETLPKI